MILVWIGQAWKPGSCRRSRLRAATSPAITSTTSTAVPPATSAVAPAEPASSSAVAGVVAVVVAVARVAAVVPAARGAAGGSVSRASSSAAGIQNDAYDDYDHDYRCNCQERPHRKSSRAGSPDMDISLPVSAPALQPWMQRGELDRRGPSAHECRFAGVVY